MQISYHTTLLFGWLLTLPFIGWAQQVQLPTQPSAYCLAVSPDEHNAATGGEANIELWDLSTRRLVRILTGHRNRVRHLCFSPDGNQLASASDDGTVRIWDTRTGHQRWQWRVLPWDPRSKDIPPDIGITFLPDGQHLAVATGTGLLRIYPVGATQPALTVSFTLKNDLLGGDAYKLNGLAVLPVDSSVWVVMKGNLFWLNPRTRQLSHVRPVGGTLEVSIPTLLAADSTVYSLPETEGDLYGLSVAAADPTLFIGRKSIKSLMLTGFRMTPAGGRLPTGRAGKRLRIETESNGVSLQPFVVDADGQTVYCHNAVTDIATGETDTLSDGIYEPEAAFIRSGSAVLTLDSYSGFRTFQRKDLMAYFARMDSLKVMTLGQRPTAKNRFSWWIADEDGIGSRPPSVRTGAFATGGQRGLFQLANYEETTPDSANSFVRYTDVIPAIWRDLTTGEPIQQFRWRLKQDRYVPLRPKFQFCPMPGRDECISASTIQDLFAAPEPTQFARWHPNKPTPAAVFRQTSPYKSFAVRALQSKDQFISLSEKAIEYWDVPTESRLHTFTVVAPLNDAATSPDGSLLAAATGSIRQNVLGLSAGDQSQEMTAYQQRVASGLNDVVVWDVVAGMPITTFRGHEGTIIEASFLADGRVISGGRRGAMRIWEPATGVVSQSTLTPTQLLAEFILAPDRRTVLMELKINSGDYGVFRYDVLTGQLSKGPTNLSLYDKRFSAAGRHLLSIDRDYESVVLFDWPYTNQKIYHNYLYGKAKAADCALLTPGDKELIVGSVDGKVTIFDVATRARLRQFKAHSGVIVSMQLSPDGLVLVTADNPGQLSCWNPTTGERLRTIETGQTTLFSMAFSPDGTRLYTGHAAGQVGVFDLATGQHIATWQTSATGDIRVLNLSPDGRQLLAGGGDPEALSRDETFRQQQQRLQKEAGPPPALLVWELNSHTLRHTFTLPNGGVPTCAAIAPNNQLIAVGADDYQVRCYDLNSGTVITSLSSHSATLSMVQFLANGQQLLSRDEAGYVVIWDMTTHQPLHRLQTPPGQADLTPDGTRLLIGSTLWDLIGNREVASFWTLAGGDWLTTLPDQSYAGTPDAARQVAYSIGRDAYGFDEFDLRFNRPDQVLQQLGSTDMSRIRAYQLAYQKRLRRAGQTEESISQKRSRPVVNITNEFQVPLVTSEPTVRLNITLRDTTAHIDRLYIWVNDVPIYGLAGKALPPGPMHSLTIVVPLGQPDAIGNIENQRQVVQVACTNESGTSSYRRTLRLQSDFYDRMPKRIHFVGVGVDRYRDTTLNLHYSVKDIRDLATLFGQLNERRLHQRDTSTFLTLLNEQVTRENILAVKRRLRTHVGPADLVVVALSGHGLLSDSLDFYYGTHDVDLLHPERRGLAYTDLESLLDSLPTQQKVLLLDACHTGEVDRQISQTTITKPAVTAGVIERGGVVGGTALPAATDAFTLMQQTYNSLTRGTGAFVVAAAGGHQYAYEGETWRNGVFTYALLQALQEKKANADNNSVISIREVATYVQQQVYRLTKGRQLPAIRTGNPYVNFGIRNSY